MNSLKASQVYTTGSAEDGLLVRIERARLACDLSVAEHANRAGINLQTYTNIRSSANPRPQLEVVEKLAGAVGLKLVLVAADEPAPIFSAALPKHLARFLFDIVRAQGDGVNRRARAVIMSWLANRLQ